MDEEENKTNQYEETEGKNEILNCENENPGNSTEHLNRPLINIGRNEITINEGQQENLKLIQERINQEINMKEFDEIKHFKKVKESINKESINKESENIYKNFEISNNNFYIDKQPENSKSNKNIKIEKYISTPNNTNNIIYKFDNENKFMKYNDELKRYYFNKEFSNLHINTEENFLERMKFDIYKRQIKEQKIDDFVRNNKVKIKEEKKIKTFNHLIEDANRRLKAQINSENMNNQLSHDLLSKNEHKKYNYDEWDIIYKKRFKNFLDKINRKKIENKKIIEEEKMKKEEEILKCIPNKKASQKHIKEVSEKMYEEAIKRNIKKNERREKFNNLKINEFSVNNIILKNKINNNILNQVLFKKINNKKNFNIDNKLKNSKSSSKIVKRNNIDNPQKNINNNKSQNKSINKSQNIDNSYDCNLDKERQILLQMLSTKKLPGEVKNNKLNNQCNLKTEEKKRITESDKIIDEFFMRNIKK